MNTAESADCNLLIGATAIFFLDEGGNAGRLSLQLCRNVGNLVSRIDVRRETRDGPLRS